MDRKELTGHVMQDFVKGLSKEQAFAIIDAYNLCQEEWPEYEQDNWCCLVKILNDVFKPEVTVNG